MLAHIAERRPSPVWEILRDETEVEQVATTVSEWPRCFLGLAIESEVYLRSME